LQYPIAIAGVTFFQVPNEAAPNYALTVEPTKPVVTLDSFGRQILSSPITLERRLNALFCASAVIGMNITGRTERRKRMFNFDPLHPLFSLRPFNFHCYF
jgi:hypothetical protein